MAKITSVEPQKNPRRFSIFLDGEFAFGADEDLVVEYRLVFGKEISQVLLEKLVSETEIGKLMGRMYKLFNIRPRSEKEVRDYFHKRNQQLKIKDKEITSALVVDLLVDKLKQKDLLNDKEFAKIWIESRRRSRKKGMIALKQELFQKGVDKDIIEEVYRLQVTGYSEQKVAEEALSKRVERWKNLPAVEIRKKAYGFLTRRGFEYSIIKEVVENYLRNG